MSDSYEPEFASFMVFSTEEQINKALSEIRNMRFREIIKKTFIDGHDKVMFEGKEYCRFTSITNPYEEFVTDNSDAFNDYCETVETFFDNIGPISCLEEF